MIADFDETLRAAQDGDEAAITILWRGLHPRLLRYLRSRDPRSAEDLASETWIKAARSLARFSGGEAEFRAWMFTIGRRCLIDAHRRERRRPERLAEPADFQSLRAPTDTQQEALESIRTEAALALVQLLPVDQADAILLRVVAGLDTPQVAKLLGKRTGTVRVLQHRGLRRLAEMLGTQTHLDEGATR